MLLIIRYDISLLVKKQQMTNAMLKKEKEKTSRTQITQIIRYKSQIHFKI